MNVNPETVGTSTSLLDLKQHLEHIVKLCGKISVAKKETSQLAALCKTLSNRLSDRSLILRRSGYEDIKSNLARVEEQLTDWSKFNYPKSLMKKAQIETGVTGFVGELDSIFQGTQPTPTSSLSHQGAHTPDRGSVEGIPPKEGAREDIATSVTGTGHNAGTFVASTKNAGVNAGSLMFQKHESLSRYTTDHETQDGQLVEPNEAAPVKRLDGEVTILGDIAFSGGMYCEIWAGEWRKGGGGKGGGEEISGEKLEVEKVALKALRSLKTLKSPEMARKRLESELSSWEELRHQNILPFYGIVTDIGPHIYMVSPWQENGNLLLYVKKARQPNKHYLLRGSAAGLSYLHSRGVVHGSVKCKNVLVSHEGEPLICDFGIARISEEINENTTSKTMSSGDIVRYLAPELIENNNFSPTTHSDTYSFAMLIIECITEEVPFSNLPRDAAVIHARISKRQCPPRPEGQDRKNLVSDSLWELMMRCWAVRPDQRPTMEQVHSFFLHYA